MLDLVIRGGRVVTPAGTGAWDIGVQGEQIVAVAVPGTLPADAARTIDAAGKIVVPGGIEAHAHVGSSTTPNNAGPAEQSLAAIMGGTTTVIDFTRMPEQGDLVQATHEYMARWQGQAYTDYSTHCTIPGTAGPEAIAQIKDLIASGFPSIKLFTTSVRPPRPGTPTNRIDMGRLEAVMQETAKHGGMVAVHAEDDEIVQYNYARAQERGLWDWYNMHLIHSNLSEDLSFRRVLRVAEWAGAAMYFVHTSAKEGVNAIGEARSRSKPIYGETLLLYCSFNAERYKEPDGMKYHTYPSLKFEEDRLRLWNGLTTDRGDMSIMATDSICTSYAVKTEGKTIDDVQGGNVGIEVRMGLTYGDGVAKQGMSLDRYAAITSTNVAKILGLYPQKGAVAAGSDADITIIDPAVRKRLTMEDLHITDYIPWEGWQMEGWPTTMVLRGTVMVENGSLVGTPTTGKLIARKLDSTVLQRPVC